MMNDLKLSFYFWFRLSVYAQCISSSLKNRITEHYPDSQVILQQEVSIRICCTLSFNIVDACFDHRYSTAVLQTKVQNACKTDQSLSLILCQG